MAFLYMNNAMSQKELLRSVTIIITMKRLNYLTVKLTKYSKDLYIRNWKILKKKSRRHQRKEKSPNSWIGIVYVIEMSILSEAVCKLGTIQIKTTTFS